MCRSGGNHKLCISIRAAAQPALQPSITISPTTVPNFQGCCAVSTVVISPPANQADKLDLAEFVYRFGQQPDSWLATGPGRTAFWSEGRRGLVSYTVRGGFAMVGGGLICPPDEQQQLLLQFLSFCKSRKWRPVFFLSRKTTSRCSEIRAGSPARSEKIRCWTPQTSPSLVRSTSGFVASPATVVDMVSRFAKFGSRISQKLNGVICCGNCLMCVPVPCVPGLSRQN